jgi:EmrB/QacA subfamily drug resistance transporter
MTTPGPRARLSRWQTRTVLTVLLTGQLLAALDQTVTGTALPTILGQLGGLRSLSLLITVYLLTSTVSTPLYGKLADTYGAKPVYMAAIGIFTLGSALTGLSQNAAQVVIFRAVQGAGAGGLVVIAFTISASVVPPRQIGRVQGLVGMMYMLASLAGPLIGGAFTQYASWRWCFLINVPIGLAALAAVAVLLRLPAAGTRHRIDYLGAVLLVAAVSVLLLITVWGGTRYAWDSGAMLGVYAGGIVLAAMFVVRERQAPEPISPVSLFRNREIALALVITFLVGIATIGAYFFLPIYLQIVRGYGPTTAGLGLLPMMLGVAIGSGASGWLIATILGKVKVIVLAGLAIITVSLFLIAQLDASSGIWSVWTDEALLGVGMGFVISKLIMSVQNQVDRRMLGTMTAQGLFVRVIGSAIGAALLSAVLVSRLQFWQRWLLGTHSLQAIASKAPLLYQDPKSISQLAVRAPGLHAEVVTAFARSLHTVFLVATPLMLLAFVLAWLLPGTRLRDERTAHAGAGAGVPGTPAGQAQPQNGVQQPRDGTQQPNGVQQPRDATHQPQNGTQQPQNGVQQPQNGTQQPRERVREALTDDTP